ncbi:MAG: 4Fe-4S binding protein, partial [Thermoplasmata archaeon]|nr:4Fe-4S binding protein [Thermoplasmata archaeon]
KDKKCPAKVCKALIQYRINPDNCIGCGLCRIGCPQDAIRGEKKKPHIINSSKCIKCGVCFDICKFDAVEVV